MEFVYNKISTAYTCLYVTGLWNLFCNTNTHSDSRCSGSTGGGGWLVVGCGWAAVGCPLAAAAVGVVDG